MQTREKLLAGGLALVLAVGWILPGIWSAIRAPVADRQQQLRSLKRRLDAREYDELQTMVAVRKIADWKKRSLSEDALTAQRVYQAWLNQLADQCGWRDVEAIPGRTRPVGPGSSVSVEVTGLATVAEIAEFLRRFNKSGLLHAVDSSVFTADTSDPDVPIEVSITAAALSLPDGGPTPLPYAEFSVSESTSDPARAMVAPALTGVDADFDIAVMDGGKTRIATVADVDEDGHLVLKWDGNPPERLTANQKLIVEPFSTDFDDNVWDALAGRGPFALPRSDDPKVAVVTPESNEPPRWNSYDPGRVLPGETWSTKVSASDPDGDDEGIRYSVSSGPSGLSLDNGEVSFTPSRTAAPEELTWELLATDVGGATSTLSVSLEVASDPEMTTELVGAVRIDNVPTALFIDWRTGERIVRRVGEDFVAGRFRATVESIDPTEVVFVSTETTSQLQLGDRLVDRKDTPIAKETPVDPAPKPTAEKEVRD